VRELEGSLSFHKNPEILGLLVSPVGFTSAALAHAKSSAHPLVLVTIHSPAFPSHASKARKTTSSSSSSSTSTSDASGSTLLGSSSSPSQASGSSLSSFPSSSESSEVTSSQPSSTFKHPSLIPSVNPKSSFSQPLSVRVEKIGNVFVITWPETGKYRTLTEEELASGAKLFDLKNEDGVDPQQQETSSSSDNEQREEEEESEEEGEEESQDEGEGKVDKQEEEEEGEDHNQEESQHDPHETDEWPIKGFIMNELSQKNWPSIIVGSMRNPSCRGQKKKNQAESLPIVICQGHTVSKPCL